MRARRFERSRHSQAFHPGRSYVRAHRALRRHPRPVRSRNGPAGLGCVSIVGSSTRLMSDSAWAANDAAAWSASGTPAGGVQVGRNSPPQRHGARRRGPPGCCIKAPWVDPQRRTGPCDGPPGNRTTPGAFRSCPLPRRAALVIGTVLSPFVVRTSRKRRSSGAGRYGWQRTDAGASDSRLGNDRTGRVVEAAVPRMPGSTGRRTRYHGSHPGRSCGSPAQCVPAEPTRSARFIAATNNSQV